MASHAVCIVVVTYHPDDAIEKRLASALVQAGSMVVVDNHSAPEAIERLRVFASQPGVVFIENPENRGLAAGLNQGVAWAGMHGYSWCLLLDQDSTPASNIVTTQLLPFLTPSNERPLAVVGSSFAAPSLVPTPMPPDATVTWRELPAVITSGSLISLDAYREIGPFREEFFVDAADIDYCLRARAKGYRVLETHPPLILHRVGSIRRQRFLWRYAWVTHHPPWRRYLMLRNCTALIRSYGRSEPAWARAMTRYMVSFTLRIILFEDQKAKKLWYELRGLLDGLSGNFQRTMP
ncbi:MAG: glycosyltransferase family 2 protein [Hyphomicrobiales bacterium]|nr:glycosyltransferase family 2 protein [Hyphomicrobiales bacterium]